MRRSPGTIRGGPCASTSSPTSPKTGSTGDNPMKRPNKKSLPRQAGLTLIELLIGVAISTLLVTAFLTLYAEGQRYLCNQNARSEALEDSRRLFLCGGRPRVLHLCPRPG